jgi:hypothetical protein
VADIVIVPHNSESKPFDLKANFENTVTINSRNARARNMGQDGAMPMENPVPWIKVGNLYLSAFETGDTSWMPVVKQLAQNIGAPKSLFTILTGRHGDALHFTDASNQFVKVADIEHLNQDLQRVAELKEVLPKNVDMMVVDVTDPDFNSPIRLRNWIAQHLQGGRVVVLAWCYSIYALRGISTTATQKELQDKYTAHTLKSVKEMVNEDWQFAL